MELDERLKQWISGSLWVTDPALAVTLVPALAAEAPPLSELPGPRGESVSGVVITFLGELVGPLLATLQVEATRLLAGEPPTKVEEMSTAELAADPLVIELLREIEQTRWPGLRAQGLPSVALVWATSKVLSARSATLPGADPGLARAVDERVNKVLALDVAARGKALARLSWAIAARLAAAVNLASRADPRVDSGGLHRALLPNPLVMAIPKGDAPPSLELVAAIQGITVDGALLGQLQTAAQAALQASAARLQKGKPEPMDLALAAALPRTEGAIDALTALLHPIASGVLLAGIPELIDAKGLAGAGLSKEVARSLGDRTTLRALTALWTDLRLALLRWDLLSTLVNRVYPVRYEAGRWHGPHGLIPGDGRWSMLVPRSSQGPAALTVVAVRLTPFREALQEAARRRNLRSASGPLSRLWSEAIHRSAAVAETLIAEHGVAVFSSPTAALAFARALRTRVGATKEVAMGPGQEPTAVAGGVALAVGIATGEVLGGSDGRTTWLGGLAVTEALALSGQGAPGEGRADPSGRRATQVGPGTLRSEGIVASAAALEALLEGVDKAGGALHRAGEGARAGGIADDFRSFPIGAWWEFEGDVAVAWRFEGPTSPVELLILPRDAFAELHKADARAPQERKPSAAPAALAADARSGDVFGDRKPAALAADARSNDAFGDRKPAALAADARSGDVFGDRKPAALAADARSGDVFGDRKPAALAADARSSGVFGDPFARPEPPRAESPPPRIGPPMIPIDVDEDEEDNPTAPDMTPALPLGNPVAPVPPPPSRAAVDATLRMPVSPPKPPRAESDSFGGPSLTSGFGGPSLPGGSLDSLLPGGRGRAPEAKVDPFGGAARPSAPAKADPFGGPSRSTDAFARSAATPKVDPFGAGKAEADPFGGPSRSTDAFARSAATPKVDPFGAKAEADAFGGPSRSAPKVDPFGAGKADKADPFGGKADKADPFAAAPAARDPFGAAPSTRTDPFQRAAAPNANERVPLVGALAILEDEDEAMPLGTGEDADDQVTDAVVEGPQAILLGGDGPLVTIDDDDDWTEGESDEDSDWDEESESPIQWTRNPPRVEAPAESRDAELSFLHATYGPEGEADTDGDLAPQTPQDPDDGLGFEPLDEEPPTAEPAVNLWSAPAPAPTPPPVAPPPVVAPAPPPAPKGPDPAIAGLVRQFRGYVVKREGGAFIFGLKDGAALRDAHRFRAADPVNAYAEFLQAKIREGFVPQASDAVPLGDPSMVSEISASLIEAAYGRVKGG